jgi:biopolymer transport protein ExbD
MAGMNSDLNGDSENSTAITGINITPFVDVVLVLLIIFMITAPALMKEVMDIRLPKTSTGDGQVMQTLGVAINKDGNILLNGQITDEEGLKSAVKATLAQAQDA